MKRHLVIVYWLLLLVSTLAIGAVAFYLLQRESDRLRTAAADSVVNTGKTMANNCELLVQDLKNNSMDALASLPENRLIMMNWERNNPYVRTVFLYIPNTGLVLPRMHSPQYDALEPLLHLPHGGWVWDEADTAQTYVAVTSTSVHNQTAPVGPGQAGTPSPDSHSQLLADRQKIRQATQNYLSVNGTATGNNLDGIPGSNPNNVASVIPPGVANINIPVDEPSVPIPDHLTGMPESVTVTESQGNFVLNNSTSPSVIISQQTLSITQRSFGGLPAKPDHGWMEIGPADDSRWLGWMRPIPGGLVRGIVLSWASLNQPFANILHDPANHLSAAGYILRNPAGQAVAARFANAKMVVGGRGNDPVDDANAKPVLAPLSRLPLDPDTMPGWTLEAYFDPSTTFTSFMAVNTVLVTILVISVLVGGTLLLREARREASEAARKTNFVSNVSHELKTPLTTIRMYAELLGEGRVRDQAKQNNYLSTIIGESQRLTRLVNNVLDFSRLEQGRKQYHPDDISLVPVIAGVLEAQRPRLEEAGLVVETSFPPDGEVRVRADRDALEQVLINLLDNAMKYAAAGRWLGVRVQTTGEQASVTVSDHGPGVPPAHQERIFEMFHRVDDSITSKLPGAGLGLSIARRLLRDQEGDLRYEPNPPQGASFVAVLPLVAANTVLNNP